MEKLIERVIEQIKIDFISNDVEPLEELLTLLDKQSLIDYLPEEVGNEFKD
jgi:hypothetical protein